MTSATEKHPCDMGTGLNPDSLPVGLTISDDGNLLNWRGENYVKQSTLSNGTLTAEQVRKAIRKYAQDDSCYIFEVYGEMCGPIADELNAELGSGTCKITATATNNLMYPDYMTKWYELSCGHSLTLKGDEAPKWCAVCGKVVEL